MANRSELVRRFAGVSAGLVLALGLAGCRDAKPAHEQLGEGGPATPPDAAPQPQSWANWPMPNAAPGLPNPQSFEVQGASVVLDHVTGLMWQQMVDDQQLTFAAANQHCADLSLAGYDDWRLPSRLELVSILDTARTQPAVNQAGADVSVRMAGNERRRPLPGRC